MSDWAESMRKEFRVGWKSSHAAMQFAHRLDSLRSLSMVKKVADAFFLSEKGMSVVKARRLDEARSHEEAEALSHTDIDDKLRLIGEFFEFLSVKRASVNEARPPKAPKLREDRQLDCLWARVVNFGGKIQYAFDVQISGSIADAVSALTVFTRKVFRD